MQVNTLGKNPSEEKINITDDLLGKAIKDLRNLSHTLSTDWIKEFSIVEFIKQTLLPLEKSGNYTIKFTVDAENIFIKNESALIIYRIIQEALNNIVKHANAKEIFINIETKQNKIHITIKDNGKGFDTTMINKSEGIGLKNMIARAKLTGALFTVNSKQSVGTIIEIII